MTKLLCMIMIHAIEAFLNDFNMIKLKGTIFLPDTHVNGKVKAPPDENLNTPFFYLACIFFSSL